MSESINLDEQRRAALDNATKSEKQVRYFMYGIFVWEVVLLSIIILFIDFSNDLHVIIFLSTAIVYGTIGIGLMALGSFIRHNTLKVLAALELMYTQETA